MSCTWSDRRQGWVIGVDVAMPSVWSRSQHIFTNYGAGGAWSGSDLDTAYKKSPWAAEYDVDAHWMSGSNGNGGIYRRLAADVAWTNQTVTYYGQVDEGGSSNPRSAGSRLGVRVGVRTFLSCTKAAGRGIAKADTLGGSWADWAFGTSRQYTAIVASPTWGTALYASSDGTIAATDGVWIMTGLSSGTATVTQLDTVGTGAPTLADVRDVFAVTRAGVDYIYATVGTTTDRGVWECKITHDPADGGFVAATHVTWRRVFTCDDTANDRPQSCCAYYYSDTDKIYLWLGLYSGNVDGTGTWTEYNGPVNNYKRTHYRCADALAVSPTWTTISNATNVSVQTDGIEGINHPHMITIIGESSVEKGRIGGSNHSCQSINVNPAGTEVCTVGKSTPWICRNPRDTTPLWRPYSYGLGALAGGYQGVIVNESSQGWFAFTDDDRGGWLCEHGTPAVLRWCLANDNSGIPTTSNATFAMARHYLGVDNVNGGLLFAARDLKGYRVRYPFSPPAAQDVILRAVGAQAEVNGTSVAVSIPGTALVGDLLILHGTTRNATGAFPAISGWVAGGSRTQGSNQRSAWWYRYMQEGDTSVTLVAANTGTLVGTVASWGGVDGAVPQDVAEFDEAAGTATTYQLSTPLSTITNRTVVVNLVATSDDNELSMTTANGFTAGYQGASYSSAVGTKAAQAMAYKLVTPAGASGSAPVWTQITNAVPNDGWVGFEIALRPTGSGPSQLAILTKNYASPHALALSLSDMIGFYSYPDSGANLRYLGVPKGSGIVRSDAGGGTVSSGDTLVQAFTSIANRTEFHVNGTNLFLHVPDLGIYRSVNYGQTWDLLWNKTIADPQHRWSGHMVGVAGTNTLWVTFENGGVWKLPNAHTATAGSGTAGSVPTAAAKVTGGSLPAGTERCGAIAVDVGNGDLWVLQQPSAGATIAKIHRLPQGAGTAWKQEVDTEVAEGGQLGQQLIASNGMVIMPTSGQGLLRRVC
jgi:hypothetical protein